MKTKTEQLTEQQMRNVNGGDGYIAYDPVTGKPFDEETGGYGQDGAPDDGPHDTPTMHQNALGEG